jgi:hypothetical protein
MLRWSKDGGKTWSSQQPPRSMGRQGAYVTRVRWRDLGEAEQWNFEISISDPVRRTIIAASYDSDVGVT